MEGFTKKNIFKNPLENDEAFQGGENDLGLSPVTYHGSWHELLKANTGMFTTCEFLMGSDGITTKEGILYSVGVTYFVLKDPNYYIYTACDIYALKHVVFYAENRKTPTSQRTSRR